MQDRQPSKPGQYKATLAAEEFQKMQSGKQFTITMIRDDRPIVEGTPYSKSAVLPDSIAKSICPNIENPAPADAFRGLLVKSSHRNLLDNSDFCNPLNQRGVDGVLDPTKHVYWLDRWLIYGSDAGFHVENKGVHITNGGSATCGIYQRIEATRLKAGKTYTLAVGIDISDENNSDTIALSYSTAASAAGEHIAASKYLPIGENQTAAFSFVLKESTDGVYNFRIRATSDECDFWIKWVALYEGEYTDETLPEYQPKDYAHELSECMRYFQIFCAYVGAYSRVNGDYTYYPITFGVPMRTDPTVTVVWDVDGIAPNMTNQYGLSLEVTKDVSASGTLLMHLSADL